MSQAKEYQSSLSSGHTQISTYLDFIQNRKERRAARPEGHTLFPTADEKMMRIQDIIWQIAASQAPILITGESGVGKEVVARAIYEASPHPKTSPFVAVNCAAMPATLLESELFGFEKGAFTGADHRHIGKFEQANQGTILLDEITEIELSLQSKLLRVLQEKEIDRIGGSAPIPIQARIIATTNQDLTKAVAQGKFRQDLYYRLYVLHIEIPPLRERPRDIEFLAKNFLQEYAIQNGRPSLHFTVEAIERLKAHKWPGNVRELQNVVQRAAILSSSDQLTLSNLLFEGEDVPLSQDWIASLPIGKSLRSIETQFILETLKHHQGNRTHAAKTLGISLRTLRNKINEFMAEGIDVISPVTGRSPL